MAEMAEPVHFIPQQSQLTSPTFDHTHCPPGQFRSLDRGGSAVMLSRSVSGVFPDTAVLGMRPGGVRTELIYETTIPTIEGAAETAARLSRPQLEQERARH